MFILFVHGASAQSYWTFRDGEEKSQVVDSNFLREDAILKI